MIYTFPDNNDQLLPGVETLALPKHVLPTTVVGSYPQPDWLVDRQMLSKSVPRTRMTQMWRIPDAYLEQAQDDATIVAIRDMERAGIDIVTDGEIRRESYSNRFATALEGIDAENPAMITSRSGQQTPVPRVVGEIRRTGPVELQGHGVPAPQHRTRGEDHPARPVHDEPAGQERILQGRRRTRDGDGGGGQRRSAGAAEGRRRRHPARRALGAQRPGRRQALRREGDQSRAAGHHGADRGARLFRLCRGRARRDQAVGLFLSGRARRLHRRADLDRGGAAQTRSRRAE